MRMTKYFPAALLLGCACFAEVVNTVAATTLAEYEIGTGLILVLLGLVFLACKEIEYTPEMPYYRPRKAKDFPPAPPVINPYL